MWKMCIYVYRYLWLKVSLMCNAVKPYFLSSVILALVNVRDDPALGSIINLFCDEIVKLGSLMFCLINQ